MNYSKQREKILDALTNNAIHPTAEKLLDFLDKDNSNIGITTLYRNLNQLADAGMIKKIDGLEPSAHFDHNTFEHYHFICEKCGKIIDVFESVEPPCKLNEHGVSVTSSKAVFYGVCADCNKKQN